MTIPGTTACLFCQSPVKANDGVYTCDDGHRYHVDRACPTCLDCIGYPPGFGQALLLRAAPV